MACHNLTSHSSSISLSASLSSPLRSNQSIYQWRSQRPSSSLSILPPLTHLSIPNPPPYLSISHLAALSSTISASVTHCKKGRGLIKVNGSPIELVKPEIFRYKAFDPILRCTDLPISAAASHSAKVSDRIVRLFAIDLDGNKREVVGLSGQTLLRALANAGLIDPASHRLEEIDACSTECELHIAQEWLEKMPEPSYEERQEYAGGLSVLLRFISSPAASPQPEIRQFIPILDLTRGYASGHQSSFGDGKSDFDEEMDGAMDLAEAENLDEIPTRTTCSTKCQTHFFSPI